jgi:CTP synthase
VHAGIANDCHVTLEWVDSEQFENGTDPEAHLKDYDGILVGPGFGSRGIEGKIKAVRYARENKRPYFGICLGMQVAVIELARHCCGLSGASSTEFDPQCADPIISLLSEQKGVKDLGGTMRLGAYRCELQEGTKARVAYDAEAVYERHRHRYEFNNAYLESLLNEADMVVSGKYAKGDHDLVEIIEVKDHPWFCATQFHPEFRSKPVAAQPLFREFVRAALDQKYGSA